MSNEKKKAQKNQVLQKKISQPRSQPTMTINDQIKIALTMAKNLTMTKTCLLLVAKMKKAKMKKVKSQARKTTKTVKETKNLVSEKKI